MIIETSIPITMLLVDENIVPGLIIDLSSDILARAESYTDVMSSLSNMESYVYEATTSAEGYDSIYEEAFGESSDIMGEINWGEIEGFVNDERYSLIQKIRDDVDRCILKQ